QRPADRGAAHLAQHNPADHRAGGDWHGWGHSGRSHDELPRTGRAASGSKLGLDAERCALAPVRFAAPGVVPGCCGDARGAVVQLYRRRVARLSRSAIADRGGAVAAADRIQAVTFTGVAGVLLVLLEVLPAPNCCQICSIVANACCAAERLPAWSACPSWLSAWRKWIRWCEPEAELACAGWFTAFGPTKVGGVVGEDPNELAAPVCWLLASDCDRVTKSAWA